MEKEKKELDIPKILLYVFEGIVFVLALFYVYSTFKGTEQTGIYSEHAQMETIKALINGLQLQDIHEVPFADKTPKIQLYITEDIYFVNAYYIEIVKGDVIIHDGESDKEDIIIRTTRDEIMKMVENNDYAEESFLSGRTEIEEVGEDFVLFSKGYPDFEKMLASG
ncbi:MAG: hypothetical protein PHQ66_00975 [Candidatus Nanoarchaeia archaeon]|nr:hypothetical protein [Candidatus Nanoarchaeia archaeon]MDD5358046.1 hypothetical protein [Candidatus Nanoarchaeia archaeon]MDD5588965.1 hypothetical protein [Candidatus Nanoarchaeia archaeon]